MSLDYRMIEVFTNEEAKYKGQSLHAAIVLRVRDLRIAARCIVLRGVAGCYETGEIATQGIEVLSFNMPLKIEIILPSAEPRTGAPHHRRDGWRGDSRGGEIDPCAFIA